MSYKVEYTETTNPAKPSITVEDQTLNSETSLTFVGKNYAGYAPKLAENFLHLLENFAKTTPPSKPVEGQIWYDNTPGINILKVYDGTTWSPTGSIKKSATEPTISNTLGDIWVNTDKNQLYISSGSNWLLVGPQYSSGLKTGPEIETIIDTNDSSHDVTTIYSDNYRIAIISKTAFTPKTTLSGFASINQGITLSSIDATNADSPTKFWGRASEADALNVNGTTVSSTNFLRSDVSSTTNNSFSVRSNFGITIGTDLSFNIGTDDTATTFYSKNKDKNINFRATTSGSGELNPGEYVFVSINAQTGRVGIGCTNADPYAALNPQATLDVTGDIRGESIEITNGSTGDSTGLNIGSIVTYGGLSVAQRSNFGDDITSYGTITVRPSASEVAIVPNLNNTYDIGSSSFKFRNIFANSFVGNFNGTFTGGLTGNISGSAAKLATPTTFRIRGDVTSDEDPQFDGQQTNAEVIFNTTIGKDLIDGKPEVTESLESDMLLVYRSGNISSGLKKVSKANFTGTLPLVPVGAIFPYAGISPPQGYLFCDGSEVSISAYNSLFLTIGYRYKPQSELIGISSFALPDLRGRFALGRDNMDNGLTINVSQSVVVDAGGGPANNVTSVAADTIGVGSGNEQKTIAVSNLPDHKHNMNSGNYQYYAVGMPGTVDANALPNKGLTTGVIDGYGLPNSGGVQTSTLGQALNVMNPYLTINYIIYTGVIV